MQAASEQVQLMSRDGFSVSLPSHLLLASSKLARRIFIPGEECHDIILPSVRWSTLLLLVEILRSGVTSNQGKEIMGDRLTDINELMEFLDIPGRIDMTRIGNRSFELHSKLNRSGNETEHVALANLETLPRSYTPVVEIKRMNLVNVVKLLPQDSAEVNRNISWTDVSGSAKIVDRSRESDQSRMCQFCKKMNSNWTALKKHIKNVHREALFSCGHCSKKFVLEKFLKEHVYRA